MKKTLLVIGSLKNRPEKFLFDAFYKRLIIQPSVHEIIPKSQATSAQEADMIMGFIKPNDHIIALDEKGLNLKTHELNNYLTQIERHTKRCVFIIGGNNGLHETIKERAHISIAFGNMTWPHLLVRILLIEQLYRCQQITNGHPYHRG